MRPFRIILVDETQDSTTTFVVPLDRAPDSGSIVELPRGQHVLVRHVLSAERDGLAGIVLAAPAKDPAPGATVTPAP
jgi:hypothetical protein